MQKLLINKLSKGVSATIGYDTIHFMMQYHIFKLFY